MLVVFWPKARKVGSGRCMIRVNGECVLEGLACCCAIAGTCFEHAQVAPAVRVVRIQLQGCVLFCDSAIAVALSIE